MVKVQKLGTKVEEGDIVEVKKNRKIKNKKIYFKPLINL